MLSGVPPRGRRRRRRGLSRISCGGPRAHRVPPRRQPHLQAQPAMEAVRLPVEEGPPVQGRDGDVRKQRRQGAHRGAARLFRRAEEQGVLRRLLIHLLRAPPA